MSSATVLRLGFGGSSGDVLRLGFLFGAVVPTPTPNTSNTGGGVYVKPARPRPRPIDVFGDSEQSQQVTTARGKVGFGIRPEQSSQTGEARGTIAMLAKADGHQNQATTGNLWPTIKSRAKAAQDRQSVSVTGKLAIPAQIRSAVYPPVVWAYEVHGIALEDDEFMSDLEELEDA